MINSKRQEERIFTWKYDIYWTKIYVWDHIRSWKLNELIWEDSAKIIKSTIWEVTLEDAWNWRDSYIGEIDKSLRYKKSEYFNVRLIEKWQALVLNNSRTFKKENIVELSLYAWDWIFLWWEEIEVISETNN